MLFFKNSPQLFSLGIVRNGIKEEYFTTYMFVIRKIVPDVVNDHLPGHLGPSLDNNSCMKNVVSYVLIKCALKTRKVSMSICNRSISSLPRHMLLTLRL